MKDSSILFVYSKFSGDDWYDECAADIAALTSYDEGETWVDERIYALEDDPNNGYCYPAIIEGEDYFLVAYYHSNDNECPLTCCKMVKVMYDEIR